MRKITGQLTTALKAFYGDEDIRRAEAFPVQTFTELMKHVAQLSYLNKDHLIFYRGQSVDYRNKSNSSTFYPSIYRGERLSKAELEARFDILSSASKRLVEAFSHKGVEGFKDVGKRRYIQWSILQHYEVCPTPLLDFSQSARVACSFALSNEEVEEGYFFVFGLPYLTNRISVNSEHDLVNIRLLSICPPDALRPYFQEGYLAGPDDATADFQSKDEFDFNNRLIAKFKFPNNHSFWGDDFSPIPKTALYPIEDKVQELCKELGQEIGTESDPGQLGLLLKAWVELESDLLNIVRSKSEKVHSVHEALRMLQHSELVKSELLVRVDEVRKLRNKAVHSPAKVKPGELAIARGEIEELKHLLKERAI